MADKQKQNQVVLKKFAVIALAMFGFGFALVPIYKKVCQATGIDADKITVSNTQVDPARLVRVDFDSNVGSNMPWTFEPLTHTLEVHPGEVKQVMYKVKNPTDRTIVAQAIPAYSPLRAAAYFKKIECFCFTQQTLKPGEERLMPVQFVVQNDLPRDVNSIVLSYTFYEQHPQAAAKSSEGSNS